MNINQQVIIVNAENIMSYPDPQTFVENLVDHIKIQTELPSGMAMISVGQDAPDQQYQDAPWLELDESNNPIALKFYNGSSWTEISPDKSVKSLVRGLYIQKGEYEFDITGASTSWIDSKAVHLNDGVPGKFLFPFAFKAGTEPIVMITPRMSSIYNSKLIAANDNFKWVLDEVSTDGFSLQTWHDALGTLSAPYPRMKFNYIAIGEIED